MSTSFLPETDSVRTAIAALFAEKPPVLVEVRFPHMGTSSDWFLCEDATDLDPIFDRLANHHDIARVHFARANIDWRAVVEPQPAQSAKTSRLSCKKKL